MFTTMLVGVTDVGNRIVLPKLTYARFGPASKLAPVIVRVNGVLSPGAVGGLNDVMTGAAGCVYPLTGNDSF